MVDYQVYSKFHVNADAFPFSDKDIANFDKWPKTQSHTESLLDENMISLPQNIHGFYLKEKKWSKP